MITEKDLQEAIAECQGTRNPNANTCVKLAAYYTILDHVGEKPASSFERKSSYDNRSEFAQAIQGKDMAELMPILEELMETIKVLHPRLYNSVLRKLS